MSGVVRAMREKLAVANEKTGRVPPGIGLLIPTAATILAGPSIETIQHVVDVVGDVDGGGQAAIAEDTETEDDADMPELVTDSSDEKL
jgi:hypothetical protein